MDRGYCFECFTISFLILFHIPMIPMVVFVKEWGRSHDSSFHHFLEHTEGTYGRWYVKPLLYYFSHFGCEIMRYMNSGCDKAEYELVNRLDQCRDVSPGFFYWDSMYHRPEDAA